MRLVLSLFNTSHDLRTARCAHRGRREFILRRSNISCSKGWVLFGSLHHHAVARHLAFRLSALGCVRAQLTAGRIHIGAKVGLPDGRHREGLRGDAVGQRPNLPCPTPRISSCSSLDPQRCNAHQSIRSILPRLHAVEGMAMVAWSSGIECESVTGSSV